MKLYEFEYIDNQNLPESELFRRIGELMKTECELQGWAPGYAVRECQQVRQNIDGTKTHTFEVVGLLSEQE